MVNLRGAFPPAFLWGAATSAHQIEGDNSNNDAWAAEHDPKSAFVEVSGSACDSYHRFGEDISIVASLGLNAYRFSLEWSRIEPQPGDFSIAALGHYREMILRCLEEEVTPVVTLHHFTNPRWVAEMGGWTSTQVVERFANYCERVIPILAEVDTVCTINEPNVLAGWAHLLARPPVSAPGDRVRDNLMAAHHRARDILRADRPRRVGLTLAMNAWEILPGGEEQAARLFGDSEDWYLSQLADDDFVGVQTYTSNVVDASGLVAPDASEPTTLTGWRIRPRAVAEAVRRAHSTTGLAVLVTENGIATDDDDLRSRYIEEALASLAEVVADGIPLGGYFHWSLLDNFEWLHGYRPTFGLVAVDRQSFARREKPSARRYAELIRSVR